jgi:hypothetical protein
MPAECTVRVSLRHRAVIVPARCVVTDRDSTAASRRGQGWLHHKPNRFSDAAPTCLTKRGALPLVSDVAGQCPLPFAPKTRKPTNSAVEIDYETRLLRAT